HLDAELANVPSYSPPVPVLEGHWKGMVWPNSVQANFAPETGVNKETLTKVGMASIAVPTGFEVHPKVDRHIKNRLKSLEAATGIDWATAEALAFGSLMLDGCDIRISGQDVGRGTFSQRHAMLVDQKTEGVVVPLNESLQLESEAKLELAN
ncbi:hypothetical protein H0H93_002283, partial [Arthromyces matolae]